MREKQPRLAVSYRHRPARLAKLMAVPLEEAEKALCRELVTSRRLPEQGYNGYRKAEKAHRRLQYRPFSRALGHRLEGLPPEQRALLLLRWRDNLPWEKACRRTHYTKSGAMKVQRRFKRLAEREGP